MLAFLLNVSLLLMTSIIANLFAYHQNDYHLIYERAFVTSCNPKFVSNVSFELQFFNRTTKSFYFQVEIKPDFNSYIWDVEVGGSSYKFMSNEYRGFPITVKESLCQEIEHSKFGVDYKQYSNLTNCPWKEGVYVLKDYIPDETKYPPFIPHGRYKTVITATYKLEVIMELNLFVEIKGVKKIGNQTVFF